MADSTMRFVSESVDTGTDYTIDQEPLDDGSNMGPQSKFPPPILKVSEEVLTRFKSWMDEWIVDLEGQHTRKLDTMAKNEDAYRGLKGAPRDIPFKGACSDTIPAVAMAVDPVHARLETGVFKQDPVFSFKALKKSTMDYAKALEWWFDFYQKNRLNLRTVASPRIHEMTKHGTMVFKTIYERIEHKIKTYDTSSPEWKVIDKKITKFKGPRILGISLNNFMYPSLYENVQDCPIIIERIRARYEDLCIAQASGKLANVKQVEGQGVMTLDQVEQKREEMSESQSSSWHRDDILLYEIWCQYDIDGDGLPESIVCTYHKDTGAILQLRYNWYFHQRYPYTVVPYSVTNGSLAGMGLCEMVAPFQDALTKWHQMATDNAYLANIRMFIVKKESGIEEVPRLYAGRCFFVDDPTKDFVPFQCGDIYPSSLNERQNIFGLIEKRTGISDYLTGRESPIIGSRATATSTLALIQEGTRRVEEVLENMRHGFSEMVENCLYIWIQYGLEDLDDIVFGDDEMAEQLKKFFSTMSAENVNGALAIDLSATDAAGNRQAMQQMQLQVIQIMMQYLEKLLNAGSVALQAQQQQPQLTQMIGDVMTAARNMFKDLLTKYDIRNPDDYLPDLEKYIGGMNGPAQQGGSVGIGEPPLGLAPAPGLQLLGGAMQRPAGPMPAAPGSGGGPAAVGAAPG